MRLLDETEEQRRYKFEVMDAIERAWPGIKAHDFGQYARIDCWLEDVERKCIYGWVEIKSRTNESSRYPTVFLAVRKYKSLDEAKDIEGQSFFFVKFTNEIRWIEIDSFNKRRVRPAGRKPRPGSINDYEPMIEIPVADMQVLEPPVDFTVDL